MNTRKGNVILIAALVLVMGGSGLGVSYADRTQTEVKSDITNTQTQIDDNNTKLEDLNSQLTQKNDMMQQTQASIEAVSSEIATLHQQINDNRIALDDKKEELNTQIDNLDERLRNMYKNGSIGFVDVILASEDVSDLIANLEMVKRIYTGDQDLVTQLEEEYAQIEDLQETLEAQEVELNDKIAQLNTLQQQLQTSYDNLNQQKTNMENDNKELQEQLDTLNAESAAIQTAMASAPQYTGPASKPVKKGSGRFTFPCPSGTISGEYGWRYGPFYGWEHHAGMDIACNYGASIVAADNGRVIAAGYDRSYGNFVIISHGNNLYTLYAHNSTLKCYSGQTVSRGQTIALAGSTGDSTGPHCHFEVRVGANSFFNTVNPRSYLY